MTCYLFQVCNHVYIYSTRVYIKSTHMTTYAHVGLEENEL